MKWSALLFCLALGCGKTAAVRHAESGELRELKKELATNPPSPARARDIAQGILKYEVLHAQDMQDRSFVPTLRACSAGLPPALRTRAEVRDGVGAEAAMLLLELNQLQSPERFADDEDGAFRALAARATKDHEQRQKFYVDPDERVRKAALLAASEAKDDKDIDSLLEVARLDPDPTTRSRAILTLGHLDHPRISGALRDLYGDTDEALRLAIVQAWGTLPLYEAGGRRQLLRLVAKKMGLEVVAAASRLAMDSDETVKNQAVTRLLRITSEGTTDEQRLALMMMPVHHSETSRALVSMSKAKDSNIALIANSRLLQHARYQADAEKRLLELAADEDDPSLRLQAQAALAAFGSHRISTHLKKQLSDENPTVRKLSAVGLIRLGAFREAAPLVADENQNVRRTVACQLVAAPFLPPRDRKAD